MKNIAIFASGSGTNAENIIRYFSDNKTINVSIVLSNKADAGVLLKAKMLNVPEYAFSTAEFHEGTKILQKLSEYNIDLIVLAGFLPMVSPSIINKYPHRIINIHPALLPKFGGKGMYGHHVHEAVVAAHESQTGITIHYINEKYDDGATIFQATCPVLPTDTPETVEAKVHKLEYEYYPKVIEKLL